MAFLALSGEGKDREGGKGWDRFNKRSRQFDMKETGKKKVGAHDEGASCLGKMGGVSWKIYQGLRKGGEGGREKGCGNSVSCLLRDWTFELSLVWSTWRRFNHGLCLTASLDQQCKRQGNRERPVMLNYSQDECVG